MKKTMSAVVAVWAAVVATTAQAAAEAKTCVTAAEAQAVFLAIAPDVLKSVGQKCAPSLPADATLRGGMAAFAAPYDAAAVTAWPSAMSVIARMAGPDMKGLDPAAMKPMIGPMIGAMAAEKLKPTDCNTIEHAVTLLAPLPPANVAGLVVLAASSAKDGGSKAPFTICPAVAAPLPAPTPAPK